MKIRIPKKFHFLRIVMYVVLIIVCFFSISPFLYMLSAATNKSVDIIKGRIWFGNYLVENIKALIRDTNRVKMISIIGI